MMALPDASDAWLSRFHEGDRAILTECYRECFARVAEAAGQVLASVDAETVTHEVFYRMLSDADFRAGFRGGSLPAWLAQVARNAAIDVHRRRRREAPESAIDSLGDAAEVDPARFDEEVEAKMLVERFRRERLPEKWAAVFEARFIRQLPQRDAARELGMQRTTLVYQEQRIRELLEDFLVGGESEAR
jgi:RNA polymerase sigma-70 factor (ECF subfamily)